MDDELVHKKKYIYSKRHVHYKMLWWTEKEYESSHSIADRRLLNGGVRDYSTHEHTYEGICKQKSLGDSRLCFNF